MTAHQPLDFHIGLDEPGWAFAPARTKTPIQAEASAATAEEVVGRIAVHVDSRLGRRLRDFRVLAGNNGLVLRGHVPTYYAKQLAQQAVMEITELPIRANEIEVSSSYREIRHDAALHVQGR